MTLVPLPAFADNYIWMLQDGTHAIVVDPGDAKPVFDALALGRLKLAAILVTHHHADHVGGVDTLREAAGAQVFGPAGEVVPEPCVPLSQGDVAQVLASLDALAALPGDTRACCAHEYTLGNLRFARAVEPGNPELTQYLAQCEALRARGVPTLPSCLGTERSVNPFLRSREASVRAAVQAHAGLAPQAADIDVFAALRQ